MQHLQQASPCHPVLVFFELCDRQENHTHHVIYFYQQKHMSKTHVKGFSPVPWVLSSIAPAAGSSASVLSSASTLPKALSFSLYPSTACGGRMSIWGTWSCTKSSPRQRLTLLCHLLCILETCASTLQHRCKGTACTGSRSSHCVNRELKPGILVPGWTFPVNAEM